MCVFGAASRGEESLVVFQLFAVLFVCIFGSSIRRSTLATF